MKKKASLLKRNSGYRVLKVFLDSPTEQFGLREISRASELSPPSVISHLKLFEEDGLIRKYKKKGRPMYQALREDENFIFFKKLDILNDLHASGLIEFLWQKLGPDAIILYGSYAKGESIESSDIDLFIIGKRKEVKLGEFERFLNKEIHLMFSEGAKQIPQELKNNLINGIVLKGYFKVF